MPINVYTGLMRSGKSYEVVSEVIVPAIRTGRRVVTNVDGISQAKIHEYLKELQPADDETLYGTIVHVENSQVFLPDFFPYYDDHKGAHTNTIVQPGDLVCIDEAWRFWGATDCKIHKHHKSFFLEHGHFTHEKTNVACDLVLMIQDMNTLNRLVKPVVAFNFRTHKKVALGMGSTYSVTMWEGSRQSSGSQIGNWVRKYKKEVFPLYSSFKGGAEGVMVNSDSRQNIFASKKLWFMICGFVLLFGFSVYNVFKYFSPPAVGKDGKPIKPAVAGSGGGVSGSVDGGKSGSPPPSGGSVSDVWRVSGFFQGRGESWVVLANPAGAIRVASPSQFQNSGLAQVGDIDGFKVTSWSGTGSLQSSPFGSSRQSAPVAPAPASAPVHGVAK